VKYPQARLLVFAKAPVPGQVKTRLAPLLGAGAAAALYTDLLDQTLDTAVATGLCPVELWCSPDSTHAHFQDCRARHPLQLHRQAAGDLGRRMSLALHSALRVAQQAVLVGADCPALCGADLEAALQALGSGKDVVLGPATDGGYYLIGVSAHHPYLFEGIAWSTSRVLATTLTRCRQHGLDWVCLPEHADLDTPDDYLRYRAGETPAGRWQGRQDANNSRGY
jgi:rSAM/selenodomain-associated transferase 1